MYQNLSQFLAALQQHDDVFTITQPIARNVELTAVQRHFIHKDGPALVFEHVVDEHGQQFSHKVVSNLFTSKRRIAKALNIAENGFRKLGEQLCQFRQQSIPQGFGAKIQTIGKMVQAVTTRPTSTRPPTDWHTRTGAQINVHQLPIQKCWPNDVSPLITWGMVITRGPADAVTDQENYAIYRLQPIANNRLIVRWLPHRGGAQHFARFKQQRGEEKFPISVVIGADPITLLAAVTPIPDTMSEVHYAGLLAHQPIETFQGVMTGHAIPHSAEIVLEGFIEPNDMHAEGPFADHTGYYNAVEKFPVMTVQRMMMRPNSVYLTTHLSRPPDEASCMAEAFNDMFVPLIQQQFPEIIDFWLPPEACSYRMAVVSIKKLYAGQARRIMMAVWSYLRQFTYTKYIVVVDDDINARSWSDVVWAIATRADPSRDVMLVDNSPVDYLDFASPLPSLGGKMGIDATTKMGSETARTWGKVARMDDDDIESIMKRLAL